MRNDLIDRRCRIARRTISYDFGNGYFAFIPFDKGGFAEGRSGPWIRAGKNLDGALPVKALQTKIPPLKS